MIPLEWTNTNMIFIPKGHNNSILPCTFTPVSLLPLNVFFTEAKRTGKQGHLFLEYKLAAFDSIFCKLIKLSLTRISVPKKIFELYSNVFTSRSPRVITVYGFTNQFTSTKDVLQGGVQSLFIWILCYNIWLIRLKKEDQCVKSDVFFMQALPTKNSLPEKTKMIETLFTCFMVLLQYSSTTTKT
jgi:hypothetical protein